MKNSVLILFATALTLMSCNQKSGNVQLGEATVYLTREITPKALVSIDKQ